MTIATFIKSTDGEYRASNLVPIVIRKRDSRTWEVIVRHREVKLGTFPTLHECKTFAMPLINHPQGGAACETWAKLGTVTLGIGGHERRKRMEDRQTTFIKSWRARRVLATGVVTDQTAIGASEHANVLMPARPGGDGFAYFAEPEADTMEEAASELGIELPAGYICEHGNPISLGSDCDCPTHRVDIHNGATWEPHFHGTEQDCNDEADDVRDGGERARVVLNADTSGLAPEAVSLMARVEADKPAESYASGAPQSYKDRPSGRLLGLRATYWRDDFAAWVSVYDGPDADMDTSGGRWQVVCERHGSILSVSTLADAHKDARDYAPSEFCEGCRSSADDDKPATDIDIAELAPLVCELANAESVDAQDVAEVLEWCNEWARDCEHGDLFRVNDTNLLHVSHRLIEGGLAFVLEDVRRVRLANPANTEDGAVDHPASAEDIAEAMRELAQESALRAGVVALDHRAAQARALGLDDRAAEHVANANALTRMADNLSMPSEPGAHGHAVDAFCARVAEEAAQTWQTSGELAEDVRTAGDILRDLSPARVPSFLARVARVSQTWNSDRVPVHYSGLDILDKLAEV